VIQPNPLFREVDVLDGRQHDAQSVLSPQDPANGRRNVPRRQAGGGDLIQQRREDVMVVAIDQRHVTLDSGERAGGIETREPAADDHDLWALRHTFIVLHGD
jgi:hypothetical protein